MQFQPFISPWLKYGLFESSVCCIAILAWQLKVPCFSVILVTNTDKYNALFVQYLQC